MTYTIDSIDLDSRDGFDLRAEIVPDDTYYSEPDGDYTPEQIAAFRNRDWCYVGITVTASRAGIDLGSDSLWAVEFGFFPMGAEVSEYIDPLRDEGGSLDTYRDDLVDNAIADARLKLTELADQ